MNKSKIKTVSVIGLGKLGSPILACFASKDYQAVGIDVNLQNVRSIVDFKAPVKEPGLQEMIDINKERISATSDWNELILNSAVSFIVVPTPSVEDGSFSNDYAVAACNEIGKAIRGKKDFHLVVMVSTVMPGSSEKIIIPALENASGKKCGVDFGYCYSPTLIALGSVIKNFLNPDVVMIGESDINSGQMLENFYRSVFENEPKIQRVKPVEAELAKISLNTFVTTKISFANMLGQLCEKIPGANVDNVSKILGADSRIGPKYLKAGTAYGGPCFPRDNRALIRTAENLGVDVPIPKATDKVNRKQTELLLAKIEALLIKAPNKKIGVLGMAYKLDTDVIEESAGYHLVSKLISGNASVVIYDALAADAVRNAFGNKIEYASSLDDFLIKADFIVITNPYSDLALKINGQSVKGKIILDLWRVLDAGNLFAKLLPFGVGENNS